MIIISIPLSYVAGSKIMRQRVHSILKTLIDASSLDNKNQNKHNSSSSNNENKLQKLVMTLRVLYLSIDCSLQQYLLSPLAVLLEQLITNHIRTCQLYPDCFCKNHEKLTSMTKDEFLKDGLRKQYIEHFILTTFKDAIKNPQNSKGIVAKDFFFIYLAFIVSAIKNQTVSLREIFMLRQNMRDSNASFREMKRINYIYQLACKEFNLNFKKTKQTMLVNIIDVIFFDESLQECSVLFHQCLQMKLSFLETISQNYINLSMLEKHSEHLMKKKNQLRGKLETLIKINSKQSQLEHICEGFQECLTIETKFLDLVQELRKKGELKNHIPLQSDTSAAIYITLLSDIGKIVKVSKNFHTLLQFTDKDSTVIGKNINSIMCEEVATIHDTIMEECINRKVFDYTISPFRLMIGKDNSGWAYPLSIKIQMCMIGNQDLGACAVIKEITDGSMYMQTSPVSDGMRIFILDKILFETLFSSVQVRNDLKRIRLSRISPLIPNLIENCQQGQVLETIIIKPRQLTAGILGDDKLDDYFVDNLIKSPIFHIKFIAHISHKDFIQLQVISLSELQDQSSRKDAIRTFIHKLRQFNESSKLIKKLQFYLEEGSPTACAKREKSIHQAYPNRNEQNLSSKNFKPTTLEQSETKMTVDFAIQEATTYQESFQIKSLADKITELPQQDNRQVNESEDNQDFFSVIQQTDRLSTQMNFKQQQTINLKNQDSSSASYRPNDPKSKKEFSLQQSRIPLNEKRSKKFILTTEINTLDNNQQVISSIENQQLSPSSVKQFLSYPTEPKETDYYQQAALINSQNRINSIHYFQRTSMDNNDNENIDNSRQIGGDSLKRNKRSKLKSQRTTFPGSQHQTNNQNKDDMLLNQNEDQQSNLNRNQSQRTHDKIQINRVIQSKRTKGNLKLISFIGILSIIIVGSLNTVSFFILLNDKNEQKNNFEKIYWCFQMKRYIGFILGLSDTYKGVASGIYYMPSSAQQLGFLQLVYVSDIYIYMRIRNMTLEMVEGDPNKFYIFQGTMDFQLEQYNMNIFSKQIESTSPTSLTYKITQWVNYAYYIVYNLDSQLLNVNMAIRNYDDILNALNVVQDSNIVQFHDKISFSKLIILLQLIVITMITGILAFFIIPIYIISQRSRERILKLHATFSIGQIDQMVARVNFYKQLLEIEDKVGASHKTNYNTMASQLMPKTSNSNAYKTQLFTTDPLKSSMDNRIKQGVKKRNLSTTNSLPLFTLKILPGLFVCLIATLFNPFATYFLNISQVHNFEASLSFLTASDYYFDNIITLFSLKYQFTYAIFSAPTSTLVTTLKTKILTLTTQTNGYYNALQETFQFYENNDLYQRELYDSFLLQMFKGDICNAIETSTDNFREISISLPTCKAILYGTFKKGLFITITKCQSMINDFIETLKLPTFTDFSNALLAMQKNIAIQTEFVFFQYTAYYSKMLHYFFQDRYADYHNHNQSLNQLFLGLQLGLLAVVLFFGWNKFYSILGRQYFASKQLLDLINIDVLLDNSYISSYFKKRT